MSCRNQVFLDFNSVLNFPKHRCNFFLLWFWRHWDFSFLVSTKIEIANARRCTLKREGKSGLIQMQQIVVNEQGQKHFTVFDTQGGCEVAEGMRTGIVHIEIADATDGLLRSATGAFDDNVTLLQSTALKLAGFHVENCHIAQIQNAVITEIGVAHDDSLFERRFFAFPKTIQILEFFGIRQGGSVPNGNAHARSWVKMGRSWSSIPFCSAAKVLSSLITSGRSRMT